jgi:hypothetical protein
MPDGGFSDDPSIPDDTEIWRCVHPEHIIFDEKRNRQRPTSSAFTDNSNGDPMSAFIAAECGGVDALLRGLPGFYIVRLTAEALRACGQIVARDPEGGGPGHVVIVGDKRRKVDYEGKRVRAREVLALNSEWVVAPPNDPQ